MIKLFITAVESRPDGTAVELFDRFELQRASTDEMRSYDQMPFQLADKIDEVQLINEHASQPF